VQPIDAANGRQSAILDVKEVKIVPTGRSSIPALKG
jgi:hypothetical protein